MTGELAQFEKIKKITLLPREFSLEEGEKRARDHEEGLLRPPQNARERAARTRFADLHAR